MKNARFLLLLFCLAAVFPATAQRLRKADRTIVNNIESHVAFFGKNMPEEKAGSGDGKLAAEYIGKQFQRSGLKPKGTNGAWVQSFTVRDGREVAAGTRLSIDGHTLELYKDYFPFPFSANKSAASTVAVALAENDVPWFKDLKDIMEERDNTSSDTMKVIMQKARYAASKGATALIIYQSAGPDLVFDQKFYKDITSIPVVYINKNVYQQYCADESAILDVSVDVHMKEEERQASNIIGYADNGADSTVVAGAHLDQRTDVAALLEIARLMKKNLPKKHNYLFVAYSGENNGRNGIEYFEAHPTVNLQRVDHTVMLDTVSVNGSQRKGLFLVKNSMQILQNP